MSQFHRQIAGCCGVLLILSISLLSYAQTTPGPSTTPADALITLNFPGNVDLKTLVDYAAQRLGIDIIYDNQQIANKPVALSMPMRIAPSALPDLVESALEANGLSLVDGDRPGWKKVVSLAAAAQPAASAKGGGNRALIEMFPLQSVDPAHADALLKAVLSGPGASSFAIPEQHSIVVTDFASNMPRIKALIDLIDRPVANVEIELVPIHHADAGQLAEQAKKILEIRAKASQIGQIGGAGEMVDVSADRRTGQLILVGPKSLLAEVRTLIEGLDQPVSQEQSPVHFYKLANATAADVLETLRSLQTEPVTNSPAAAAAMPSGGAPAALPPPIGESMTNSNGQSPSAAQGTNGSQSGGTPANPSGTSPSGVPPSGAAAPSAAGAAPVGPGFHTSQVTVAADANTNSIIVIGSPSIQQQYAQLIDSLDKRRPQVLIEATLVTLDTSNGASFGVELSGHSRPGGSDQAITFTSFGLSTPNLNTGQLALIPGTGFNGALVSSELADVIVQALANNSHSRITSAPRILVNDNASGSLSSLSEQPYTSTNIGNTLSTTSFAGYAEAGTQIVVTPHISEADYLQLDYLVSLSNFTGTGDTANGIPPPRQTQSLQSRVTIPDGSTIIIGGLNSTNYNHTIQSVPVLGQIPILQYLFSNRSVSNQRDTLFVFLRPVILRDDEFADLKFLSERDVKLAGISNGLPTSSPLPVH
jgi:general secretion pathway protein D